MTINLSLDALNADRTENFFKHYDFETMIGDTKVNHYLDVKLNPQACRFCKRTSPEVTFTMEAHVIPQFMGNKHLLSHFECDDCNQRFSQYEDSFANFIGARRTVLQIPGQGKNKVPKFKDMNTGFEITLGPQSLQVGFIDENNEVEIDEEKKKLIIKTVKPAYTPIHIPKVILKIAISMLKESDLPAYDSTITILRNDLNDKVLENNELFKVRGYHIPGPTYYDKPFAQLFTKKIDAPIQLIPNKQIVLYYGSFVYQLAIPFSIYDDALKGQEISFPLFPLLVDYSHFEHYGKYQLIYQNTTSSEKKKKEPHTMTFSYDRIDKKDIPKEEAAKMPKLKAHPNEKKRNQ